MSKGEELIQIIEEAINNKKEREIKETEEKALIYIKELLIKYVNKSIKQYNGNKERGGDAFICRKFLNFITECRDMELIPKEISYKEINRTINWMWIEVNE